MLSKYSFHRNALFTIIIANVVTIVSFLFMYFFFFSLNKKKNWSIKSKERGSKGSKGSKAYHKMPK